MLTLRPTRTLASQLRLSIGKTTEHVGSPFSDWCVNSFNVGRARFLLFVHTTTLLPAIAPARGINSPDALFDCFRTTIPAQLARGCLTGAWHQHIAPESEVVRIAPIPNRSVLGSMNEFIRNTRQMLPYRTLDGANRELFDIPLFAAPQGIPWIGFRMLFDEAAIGPR